MKKNKKNFILLTLLVSLVGVTAIAFIEHLFGAVAVFTFAIIIVFVVASYVAIENIYKSLKK